MEAHVRNRKLRDCEVFLLTDNLVAENSFYKGTSSSETLFGLILRLRKLELEGDIILHMIHVLGKRMIASGVDVLSKRDTTKGVMKGNCVLSYFPFHLGSEQRSTELLPWINSWLSGEEPLVHLSSDGWFDNVFIEGEYLWTPHPAAAQAVVEQLCRNYHLRENSLHVVCIPCLMTFLWRKKLSKVENIVLSLPFDDNVWPLANQENLILVIVLPFVHIRPWKSQGTQLVVKC